MRVILCTLNSSFTHSSLALRYLRAAIQADWPDHHLLEFQINDDLRRVVAEIGRLQPDVVAFACYIWNITATLALATDLKAVLPELKIILGGPEVGPRAQELLTEHAAINYVIQGEGEQAFPNLLQAIAKQRQPNDIAGVYYREEVGQIGSTPPCRVTTEQIPRPYCSEDMSELEHKLVYYESSRGCPFRCTYCLSGGDQVRFLPLTRVFSELRLLLAADIPLIKFVDRTFNCNPERAMQIMQFLLAERRQSRFHFEICADILTDTMLDWLITIPEGIFQFEIGVQTVNAATLQAIRRHMQWDKLAQSVSKLRKANNIHLHLDLIAGLPYQDWAALQASFDQVIKLKPHMLQLGFLKVLPGTEMAKQVQEFGLKVSAIPPYEVLATNWLSFAELNRLHVMEQLLEYYYNSGLLLYSLPYIWTHIETSPFQWFQQFALYWEAANLQQVSHGREALFAHLEAYLQPDSVLQDLLAIDKARMLASFPAHFKLPPNHRAAWENYLTEHLADWAPRTYKQAFRSVFPIWLKEETLLYLNQPKNRNIAVIDRDKQNVFAFSQL